MHFTVRRTVAGLAQDAGNRQGFGETPRDQGTSDCMPQCHETIRDRGFGGRDATNDTHTSARVQVHVCIQTRVLTHLLLLPLANALARLTPA